MSFDAKAFLSEKFEPRVVEVQVPDLKPWFDDGAKPVWKVRGLTGDELGRVNEAVERYKNINALVSGLVGQDPVQKAAAIKEALGVGDKSPASVVRELEMVVLGSVDPPADMALAIKLKDNFPIEFKQIARAILEATGKGRIPGKSKASGQTEGCEQASPSATEADDSFMSADQTSSPKDS